jgi:hypothetical protein
VKKGTKGGRTRSGKAGSKSTILGTILHNLREKRELPKGVGKYTTDLDRALLRKHIRQLYDSLKRSEAEILAQLRIGMARLNGYHH